MHTLLMAGALLFLLACGTGRSDGPPRVGNDHNDKEKSGPDGGGSTFGIEESIQPDSGGYALLPLSVQRDDRGGKSGLSRSFDSSEEYAPRFWNILFLDLRTKATHLLTDRKIMIDAVHTYTHEQGELLSRNVLYTVIDKDINKDGRLDYGDPSHLGISALDGSGFRAVSPVDEDLLGWEVVNGDDAIVIRTRVDTDADGAYEAHEEIRLHVFDLASGRLEAVVTKELQMKMNALFTEQWLKKEG
ncbi:MAG: hypothetical protein IT225_07340 [Flavobacteriales bacterium]|nr:hypothetical protein [Flavobacteriales bacterium]